MTAARLWVMLVLALLAGAAVYFVRRGDDDSSAADPLHDVDYGSIRSIRAFGKDGDHWRLAFEQGLWKVAAPTLEGGRSARAGTAAVEEIVGVLKNTRYLGTTKAGLVNLSERGLDPAELSLEIADGRTSVKVDIGRPDVREEVLYRRSGDATLFRADARLAEVARKSPGELRDPLIVGVSFARLAKFVISGGTKASMTIERVGFKWRVLSGERIMRGDRARCDELAQAVCSLSGDVFETALPGDAIVRRSFTIPEVQGVETTPYEVVEAVVSGVKAYFVRHSASGGLWRLKSAPERLLEADEKDLRDRMVLGFADDEVQSLAIEATGRAEPLRLEQRDRRWSVEAPWGEKVPVDPQRFTVYRDRLFGLASEETAARPAGEPAFRLTFEFAAQTALPPLRIDGFIEPGGGVLIARADEDSVVRVKAADAGVFSMRYFGLMRTTLVTGADPLIVSVSITTPEGEEIRLDHVADRTWKRGDHEVPYESMLGLLQKLVNFNVFEITGEMDAAAKALLEKPRWIVRWRHLSGPQPAPPALGKYTDYEWRIGDIVNESYYRSSINACPNLSFLIQGADINLVKDVVRQSR